MKHLFTEKEIEKKLTEKPNHNYMYGFVVLVLLLATLIIGGTFFSKASDTQIIQNTETP